VLLVQDAGKDSSGTLTASTTISGKVTAAPGITLAPSAGTLSVTEGASATDTMSVTAAHGFTHGVTLVAHASEESAPLPDHAGDARDALQRRRDDRTRW
jgi:hypothetical protein